MDQQSNPSNHSLMSEYLYALCVMILFTVQCVGYTHLTLAIVDTTLIQGHLILIGLSLSLIAVMSTYIVTVLIRNSIPNAVYMPETNVYDKITAYVMATATIGGVIGLYLIITS